MEMDILIERYIKQRKENKLYVFMIVKGMFGLFQITWFSYLECYKNYAIYYYIVLNLLFVCLEYVNKIDEIYKEKRKLREFNSINEAYNYVINMNNTEYVCNNILTLGKKKINLFYRYICDTKKTTSKFDYVQVIILAIGAIIGASLNPNGEINIDAFKNSIYSTCVFLVAFGMYFYSIKLIVENFQKLKDKNNAQIELIKYINQIEYNNSK